LNFDFYKNLIISEDPIRVIWEALNNIWETTNIDLKYVINYYKEREIFSNIFEDFIYHTYFEIYNILYNQIQEYNLSNFLNKEYFSIIILDALSIREGNLLLTALKKNKYKINEYKYGFSTLPSDTIHFSRKSLNKGSPSTIKIGQHKDFYYEYIKKGVIEFDNLNKERSEKLLLWVTYPDQLIHTSAIPLHEAFFKTKDLLFDILERIDSKEFIIMGDHGYISTQSIWQVGSKDKKFLKSIFKGERYKKNSELLKKQIEKINKMPPELAYVYIDDSYTYIKGRYFWSVPGHRSNISHGGLSFMECLVPIIKITK